MKIETIKNKYPSLSNVAEYLTNFRPKIISLMGDLLEWGYIRPNRKTGRGRYTRIDYRGGEIETACDRCGIKLVKFNDAPRGGRLGEFWLLAGEWVAVTGDNGETRFHAVDEVYNTRGIKIEYFGSDAKKYIMGQALVEV